MSPYAYAYRTCKHPCTYACAYAYACVVRVNQALISLGRRRGLVVRAEAPGSSPALTTWICFTVAPFSNLFGHAL